MNEIDCPSLRKVNVAISTRDLYLRDYLKGIVEDDGCKNDFTSCLTYQLLEENEKLKSEYAQLIKDKYNIS